MGRSDRPTRTWVRARTDSDLGLDSLTFARTHSDPDWASMRRCRRLGLGQGSESEKIGLAPLAEENESDSDLGPTRTRYGPTRTHPPLSRIWPLATGRGIRSEEIQRQLKLKIISGGRALPRQLAA